MRSARLKLSFIRHIKYIPNIVYSITSIQQDQQYTISKSNRRRTHVDSHSYQWLRKLPRYLYYPLRQCSWSSKTIMWNYSQTKDKVCIQLRKTTIRLTLWNPREQNTNTARYNRQMRLKNHSQAKVQNHRQIPTPQLVYMLLQHRVTWL